MIDQECLEEKIKKWKKEDPSTNIHFRPNINPESYENNVDENEFILEESDEEDQNEDDLNESDVIKSTQNSANALLLVYQTKWQRQLLLRYGQEMAFLDATYRTTQYVLSLFFLVVKTNVDYPIAATFVCENESIETIMDHHHHHHH